MEQDVLLNSYKKKNEELQKLTDLKSLLQLQVSYRNLLLLFN